MASITIILNNQFPYIVIELQVPRSVEMYGVFHRFTDIAVLVTSSTLNLLGID